MVGQVKENARKEISLVIVVRYIERDKKRREKIFAVLENYKGSNNLFFSLMLVKLKRTTYIIA